MGMSRKDALRFVQGCVPPVERHLKKIAEAPGHSSIWKWKHEVRSWLRDMEEVLRHVGKKTGEEWQARIDEYWVGLGE